MAGKRNDFYSDSIDSDRSSNGSNQSMVEKFLEAEVKNSAKKSSNDTKQGDKVKEGKISSDSEKKSNPKTTESPQKKRKIDEIDRRINELDTDIESDASEVDSFTEVPRKTMSKVGKNVFGSIEKDNHIVIPSDEENDGSGSDSKKNPTEDKQKNEADSSGKDSDILDTTMFKTSSKDLSRNQLSRVLQSKTSKPTTTRVSPECISVSSDNDSEIESTTTEKKELVEDDDEEKDTQRPKRRLLRHDQLADDTKLAQREESDRIKRLDKKNERLSQYIESQRQSQSYFQADVDQNEVVLDFDSKKKEKILVHSEITKHLKAHQVDGIKFMYDCCYGSVDNLEKYPGSGCILAHCMGLGKTLQLITLLHTVICYSQLKTDRVLVICPKSTVMNWKEEIERWLLPVKNTRKLKLFQFPEQS